MLLAAQAARRLLRGPRLGSSRSLATQPTLALVVAEHDRASIRPTLPAIAAAAKLAPVAVLVADATERPAVVAEARRAAGVGKVFCAWHPAFEHGLPEPLAALLLQLLRGPWTRAPVTARATHVLAASSTHSRAFLPRAAALLGVPMLESVTAVAVAGAGGGEFQRPVYAGNAVATVELVGPGPRVLTVRPTAFPPAELLADPSADVVRVPDEVVRAALASAPRASAWVSEDRGSADASSGARPDLLSAKVVVAAGRGMQSPRGLALARDLADHLGGAVGASRAVVDAGLAPNEQQVGQTGKVVAPELYVALGISGAIQHVAGMKDSRTIVAVNKDPEAPIFAVADIGLVADGPAAVEELLQKLPPPPGAAVPLGGAGGGQSGSSNKPSPVAAAGGEERGGRELTTGDLSFTRASDLV